jgi:hypothetical protein
MGFLGAVARGVGLEGPAQFVIILVLFRASSPSAVLLFSGPPSYH